MADPKRYKVIDGPVGIRSQGPDGPRTNAQLGQGEEVEVMGDPVEKNGYFWVQHAKGWSAVSTSGDDEVYMLDISDRDPNAPRQFRVWAGQISIRDTANGKRLPEKLFKGTEIQVDPKSRTEAANYVWWRHQKGWSAECSLDGKEIFMKEVFDVPPPVALDPAKKVDLPPYFQGKVFVQLAQATKVRGKPSTDPRGMLIITLTRGKSLEIDMSTLTEADGYYWARHDLGWSAIQSLDGKTIFMAQPGTIPGLPYIGPDGPKVADLPDLKAAVTRMPVDVPDIQWFQYYGNNMWAYTQGKAYGYDRYSQGLHGGLDFGNSLKPGIKVYAGIEGEFVKTEYPKKNNTRTYVKRGDYTFIYQHITNARAFSPGQKITPDTVLADIEHHSINQGWDHCHFEVRYMNDWIINPLLLMTEDLYNQIIAGFKPDKPNESYKQIPSVYNFFYKTDKWTKWATPLDQPMIKLAEKPIGPRYEDTQDAVPEI
jgi:hypothetical protein